MSDGEFQVEVKSRGSKSTIPVIFEDDIIPIEYYWIEKQLEEEYHYEQMLKEEIL